MKDLIPLCLLHTLYIFLFLFLNSWLRECIHVFLDRRRGLFLRSMSLKKALYRFIHRIQFNLTLERKKWLFLVVLLSMLFCLIIQLSLFHRMDFISQVDWREGRFKILNMLLYFLIWSVWTVFFTQNELVYQIRKDWIRPLFVFCILSIFTGLQAYLAVDIPRTFDHSSISLFFVHFLDKGLLLIFFVVFFISSNAFCLPRVVSSNVINITTLPFYLSRVYWFSFLSKEILELFNIFNLLEGMFLQFIFNLLFAVLIMTMFDVLRFRTQRLSSKQRERALYRSLVPILGVIVSFYFFGRSLAL